MRTALVIQGGENIAGIDGGLPRALRLNEGAFEHALKGCGVVRGVVDIFRQHFHALCHKVFEIPFQPRNIATTIAKHFIARVVVDKGVEEILQSQIFVTALHGLMRGPMNRLL